MTIDQWAGNNVTESLLNEVDTYVLALGPHTTISSRARLDQLSLKNIPVSSLVPLFPIDLECTPDEARKHPTECNLTTHHGFVLQGNMSPHRQGPMPFNIH